MDFLLFQGYLEEEVWYWLGVVVGVFVVVIFGVLGVDDGGGGRGGGWRNMCTFVF